MWNSRSQLARWSSSSQSESAPCHRVSNRATPRASRRGVIGAGALAALLAPCLFFAGYRLTLQRFATPWRNLERVANLYLEVTPGDASVARGSDVEITATPQWRFGRNLQPFRLQFLPPVGAYRFPLVQQHVSPLHPAGSQVG